MSASEYTKKVRLISLTNSHVEGIGSAEELIAYVARVSNPNNQMNTVSAPKLMRYLIKNKHWSPFELVHMTIEIKTSRAIAQQILRHRSFSFQEFSQRYAQATEFVDYPARRQDVKNRQNSIDDMANDIKAWFAHAQEEVQSLSHERYMEAIERGIAKEQARFLLPLSTATTLYMSGSIRSWIHYMQLRMEPGTQLEHREIAADIFDIFANNFPNIVAAMNDE